MKYGLCRDLILLYPKPFSIYLRGTINLEPSGQGHHVHAASGRDGDLRLRRVAELKGSLRACSYGFFGFGFMGLGLDG